MSLRESREIEKKDMKNKIKSPVKKMSFEDPVYYTEHKLYMGSNTEKKP